MKSDDQKAAEAFTKWLGQTVLGPHEETFKKEGVAAVLVVGIKETPGGDAMTAVSVYAQKDTGVPMTLVSASMAIENAIDAYKAAHSKILLPEKYLADKNRSN